MSVFIGSTTTAQRNCLSKEFKKLYAKKTFIPRKQKIAIALNTCNVGIKGVKKEDTLESLTEKFLKEYDLQATDGRRQRQYSAAQNKLIKFIVKNRLMTMDEMANYFGRLTLKRGQTTFTIK